jgi:hypothetical protein
MRRDRLNITLWKGESFSMLVALEDENGTAISLTGATITAQCRVKATNATLFTFTTAIVSPASGGKYTISIPASTTSGLTPQKGLVYDVRISFAGGDVKYWLGGDVELYDTVTS